MTTTLLIRKSAALTYANQLKEKGVYSFKLRPDQVDVIYSLRDDGEWIQINGDHAEIMPDFPAKDAAIMQVLEARLDWKNVNARVKVN